MRFFQSPSSVSFRLQALTLVSVVGLMVISGSSQPSPLWVGADPVLRTCSPAESATAPHPNLADEDLTDLKLELAQEEEQGVERVEHARELLGDAYEASAAFNLDSLNQIRGPLLEVVIKELKRNDRTRDPAQTTVLARSMVDAFVREGQRFHFDPVFLASVAMTESRFRVTVRGLAGEVGLLQLMPETATGIAKQIGIDLGSDVAKALEDPAINVRLGAVYFQALRETFDSKSEHYLSAYNMGAGRVRELLNQQTEPRAYYERVIRSYSEIYEMMGQKILKPDLNYDGVLLGLSPVTSEGVSRSVSQVAANPT